MKRPTAPSFANPVAVYAAGTLALMFALASPAAAPAQNAPAEDGSQRLTLEMYLDMESASDPQLSPDGAEIVYVRGWIDPMTDSRKSALWIMSADGSRNRYLTEGSSPRWSPSGDRLAFLACGTPGGDRSALDECDEGSHRQIYVRIMRGTGAGTVTQITRLTENASNMAWSPDASVIAFNMMVPRRDKWSIDLPRKPEGAKWTEEPRVVERLDYRQDRVGFTPDGFRHIFTVPAEGGTPRQVTEGDWDDGSPEWSPDGETIYFSGLRLDDADYHIWESEIYAADVASREVHQLTDRNGPDRSPRVSPDGRRIAYLGADSTGMTYLVQRLYVMNSDGSDPRLIDGDLERTPEDFLWSERGDGVYFTAESDGTADLYFGNLEGSVRKLSPDGMHMLGLSDIGGDVGVGVMETPSRPGDIVSFSLRNVKPRYLTSVNEDVLGDVELGEIEEIRYESDDGLGIQGWVIKPPQFDAARKYPLVLHIHGGPWAMYDVGFNFGFQHWAANDYVVLYTNPRGSTGYGQAFVDEINHAYPGKDYNDLMRGVDEVVARGYVNTDNMFVTGGSGGGVLSSWTIGHTDRFAAAAVRYPVIDWLSFVGTTDGPYWFHNFEKYPWEDPSEHLRRSPLMYAGNVKTPTLLMTGVQDLRTPISQTEEYYAALKIRKVPVKMLRFNKEWHGTSSQPSNFMRSQLYMMKWFGEHMSEDMKVSRKDGLLKEATEP